MSYYPIMCYWMCHENTFFFPIAKIHNYFLQFGDFFITSHPKMERHASNVEVYKLIIA